MYVYCELGRLPLYVERQCKMVKYWTKLLNTENCILKGCYDDMFEYSCSKPNDKQNWCCKTVNNFPDISIFIFLSRHLVL